MSSTEAKAVYYKKDNWTDIREIILDNIYSGIIFCDKDLRILFMNQLYAKLLGIDQKEAVGKHITHYFPESRLSFVLRSGQPEIGQRCSLKTEMPMLVNRIPIKKDGEVVGVILHTVFRDFTEFKDLMSKLNMMEKEIRNYQRRLDTVLSAKYTFDNVVGNSRKIVEAKNMGRKFAQTDAPVLILGPTGTGKELFAHALHNSSQRKNGPFVCVNCAAIPKELLESELFGYVSGAFTGADKRGKVGKIELAHNGTLFLDEIGDLPLNAQATILRVLDTKLLDKVGGTKSIEVNFRFIAATNKDLKKMIERQDFRQDLFYRLNTMVLDVPPLSERVEDIPSLVRYFLSDMGKRNLQVTENVMEILRNYSWPGNIRELKNVVLRAISLADADLLNVEHFPPEITRSVIPEPQISMHLGNNLWSEVARCEINLLDHVLKLTKGNMRSTAKMLGISRSTLYEKCKRHRLIN